MSERMPTRNLELKVRCNALALDSAYKRLSAEGPGRFERIRQVDTYFRASQSRLKLRRITNETGTADAELIAYSRPNAPTARWSAYHRVPVLSDHAPVLLLALSETVGVLVEVVKTRDVVVRNRTRIHLDTVERLGTFIELETVLEDQSEADASAELAATARLLGLDQLEPVAGSYSDLLLALNADTDLKTEDQ